MLKKVVSLIVGASCLLSMTGAFAAASYTGTVTEYSASGKIKVTSTVTAEGEDVTYLVYKDSKAESNIVYIDQKNNLNGTASFTFVTDSTNVGTKIATNASSKEDTVPYAFVVTDGTNVLGGLNEVAAEGLVAFDLTAPAGIVSAVSVDGTAFTGNWFTSDTATMKKLWIDASAFTGKKSATVTVTLNAVAASTATLEKALFIAADEVVDAADECTDASILVFGDVDGSVSEFGIILNGTKYQALGKNADGQFAIRFYSSDSFDNSTTVQVYGTTAEGDVVSEETTLTIQ